MHRYYQILGLPQGASVAEVKRAYRKLAFKFHPDHNPDPGARARFLAITEAYNYLINPPSVKATPQHAAQNSAKMAEEERVNRAKAAAQYAARQRYAAFKRQQEKELNRSYSQAVTIFVGILLFVGAIYFGKDYVLKSYVNGNSATTVGTLTKHYVRSTERAEVVYEANNVRSSVSVPGRHLGSMIFTPNGMPALQGLEFTVIYRKDNPYWAYVEYQKFTPRTLSAYVYNLRGTLAAKYEVEFNDDRLECLVLRVFNTFGVDGLANLFFWDASFMENFKHNNRTFSKMEKTAKYQAILEECLLKPEAD